MTSPRPSVAVVEAVANEEGCDPLDLPPLYDAVDPDSLDRLCSPSADGELTIRYHGYEITVGGAEDISVVPLDTSDEQPRAAASVSE